MSETTQTTVFGEAIDEQLYIETEGRTIRPWKQLVCQVLQGSRSRTSEFRLHVDSDGLHVKAVDPANVMLVNTTIDADAFNSYETENVTLGASGDILGTLFQHARYGVSTNDELTITGNTDELETTVEREFDGIEATFTERQSLVNPGMIRDDADVPNLDVETTIDIPVRAFIKALNALGGEDTTFKAENGSLILGQETGTEGRSIELNAGVSGDAEAIYSHSYIERLANALHVGKVDEIGVRFDDEFPVIVEFEREDVYSGEIMLAPRIGSE